jgi:hypothetical protein
MLEHLRRVTWYHHPRPNIAKPAAVQPTAMPALALVNRGDGDGPGPVVVVGEAKGEAEDDWVRDTVEEVAVEVVTEELAPVVLLGVAVSDARSM